jgi:hypothetical protein
VKEGGSQRSTHAVEHLKFEGAPVNPETLRLGERVGHTANVVGTKSGGDGIFVLEEIQGQLLEGSVRLALA